MRQVSILVVLVGALGLSGCQSTGGQPSPFASLTPAQKTQLFCVFSETGAAIAVAATKGGAQETARAVAGATVTACTAAVPIAAALTP